MAAVILLLVTTAVGLIVVPGPGTGADRALSSALSTAVPWVTSAASVVSATADRWIAVVTTVVLTGVLWWRTRRLELPLVTVLSAGGSAALMFAAKLLVDRPRPEGAAAIAMFPAFPSGHATRGMVIGLLLAWLLVRWRRHWWRYVAAGAAMTLGLGIGVSRVVLGVHWPTDVLGGWLLGAAWFAAIILILRPGCPSPSDLQAHPGSGR